MGQDKVSCPICGTAVSESDINLHLDLQCPGSQDAPRSSFAASSKSGESSRPKAVKSESQESRKSTTDDPVLVDITPTQSRRRRDGPVASIFGTASKTEPAPQGEETGSGDTRPLKRSKKVETEDRTGREEKKVKINPLTANQPLAERSRPTTLERYIGQEDIVGPGSLLRARIEAGEGISCILWGPPGCGKTTLARLIARTANADFKELSATSSGTADVRQVFEQAKNGLKLTGRKTILMVDEIHRFNKSQQDLFLPYVENGWVQLIGATTENPSFKVFTLSAHSPESLQKILSNAIENSAEPISHLPPDLIPFLADVADGDARQALNGLELALKVCHANLRQTTLNGSDSEESLKKRDADLMDAVRKGLRKGYDRSGEERYDMISALHKCLRGSDGSAAMYWLARMITGGEDALYIARRLVVVASEDVGLADNHALPLAMATYQACQTIGLPECRINLAHCVAYLAEAPKSTRSYTAYKRAEELAKQPPLPGVPLQIRNAPTKLMKNLGYGKEHSYNPDFAHPVINEYLPFELGEHSSHAADETKHILRSEEVEKSGKMWDEARLVDWEWKVQGGRDWEGRPSKPGARSPDHPIGPDEAERNG